MPNIHKLNASTRALAIGGTAKLTQRSAETLSPGERYTVGNGLRKSRKSRTRSARSALLACIRPPELPLATIMD